MRTRFILLLATALAAGGVWIAKSNYDGVCFWKGRRLTDGERFELAFKETFLSATGKFRVEPGTDQPRHLELRAYDKKELKEFNDSSEWHEAVPYKSFDEYVREYPECCKIKWFGEKDPGWPEPTFWQRVSGDYGFGVEFEARERKKRPDGSLYTKRSVYHPYFTNCGERSPWFYHGG